MINMAFAKKLGVADFEDGDVATAGQALTVELDLARDNDYVAMCFTSFSEALNYVTESWADLCSGGALNSVPTGIDPEWSGDLVIRKGQGSYALVKQRYDIDQMYNIPMRITNTFLNEEITAKVAVTSLEVTFESQALIKCSCTCKLSEGNVEVAEIPVTP